MEYMLIFTETAEDFSVRNEPSKGTGIWGGPGSFARTKPKRR